MSQVPGFGSGFQVPDGSLITSSLQPNKNL